MTKVELNRLKRLSELVIPIIENNKKQRIERERHGDFFNVFSILKVERNEVYTHSAMLCELLNPKGSHGMGDTFLKLFLEEIPLRRINDKNLLNTKTAIIKKEKSIGPINRKKETGGQIDILIEFESKEYAIVIENKIDARDQETQLARYYHYLTKNYPKKNFTILYLTKYGNEPSDYSRGVSINKNIYYWDCISYAKHIQKWLRHCMVISKENLPVVETIKQYSNLINKITDKELDMSYNKDLIKQIYSKNLFQTATEFVDIWQQKETLVAEIIADMLQENDERWIHLDDYSEPTTIFKRIDENDLYLFFEPNYFALGFYRKQGLQGLKRKLSQIIQEISLQKLDSTVQPILNEWCYITFAFDEDNTPTKTTIEDEYFYNIKKALKSMERKYKKS